MGQGRRQFTDEFKQEAVALLVSSGQPLSQIASELGNGIRPRKLGSH
jgi:transposase